MNNLSQITAKIGSILSEIRQRNELIEEAQKIVNPSFLDIISELEKEDKTLCNMLILWYCQKYIDNPVDVDELFKKLKTITKTKKRSSYISGGCDFPTNYGASC